MDGMLEATYIDDYISGHIFGSYPNSFRDKAMLSIINLREFFQENEDLGKMISSGRMAKLEGELALQKDLSEKMKQNQLEVLVDFNYIFYFKVIISDFVSNSLFNFSQA